ncbi:hypothetical protein ACRQ5Q_40715 [Bradyrhizobium sp. PMVTL-01]|uniref:hypothetical protein n=1 Tax=unclassified Bradyrhizobium TaxID=2631580 RepID=UPI003F728DE1
MNSMTHPSKPIRPEQNRVLRDDELDSVSGGSSFSMLQNAFSNVIKNIGESLATAARNS